MPKSSVLGRASPRYAKPLPAEFPNVVEGRIAEICRDLAVEAKRLRQLQEQADELRRVIRQWVAMPRRIRRQHERAGEDDAKQ